MVASSISELGVDLESANVATNRHNYVWEGEVFWPVSYWEQQYKNKDMSVQVFSREDLSLPVTGWRHSMLLGEKGMQNGIGTHTHIMLSGRPSSGLHSVPCWWGPKIETAVQGWSCYPAEDVFLFSFFFSFFFFFLTHLCLPLKRFRCSDSQFCFVTYIPKLLLKAFTW